MIEFVSGGIYKQEWGTNCITDFWTIIQIGEDEYFWHNLSYGTDSEKIMSKKEFIDELNKIDKLTLTGGVQKSFGLTNEEEYLEWKRSQS